MVGLTPDDSPLLLRHAGTGNLRTRSQLSIASHGRRSYLGLKFHFTRGNRGPRGSLEVPKKKRVKRSGRASGFEPPASWSRTKNPRTFNDLTTLPIIAKHCAKSLILKDFQAVPRVGLATAMRGVGAKNGHSFVPRCAEPKPREYWRFRPT